MALLSFGGKCVFISFFYSLAFDIKFPTKNATIVKTEDNIF